MDKVNADLQAPELPPVTLLHVTVTADAGTVLQPVNEAPAAFTLRFQVLLLDPLVVVQSTVEAALPETFPRSGSLAVKLIVLGVAVTLPKPVDAGTILPAAGAITCAFCPAAATFITPIAIQAAQTAAREPFM